MNISKDTKGLPESWASAKVDDVCLKIHYGYTATTTDVETGVKYLRITDITENGVEWKGVPFCKIEKDEIEKFALEENDLVFARTGGTVGKSYLIRGDVPANTVFASYLIRLKASKNVNPKLLAYYFQSSNYWQFIELNKTGLKTNVNAQILSNIPINVPPLNEQNRIVDKLDELLSELEKGKEQLQASLEQLKVFRQSILKHAFEGELTANERKKKQFGDTKELLKQLREKGEELKIKLKYPKIKYDEELPTIPKEWQWIRNEELLKYVTSGSRDWKKYYSHSGSIFIRTQDIKTNNLSLENAAFVKLPTKAEGKRSLVELNDILMTITGANVGKVALIEKEIPEAYVSQSVALMKYLDSRLTKYMWYYFQSRAFGQGLISNLVYGVGRPVLSLENMKEVPVAICSIEEQEAIVNEIENRFSVCDKMEAEILQALNQIEPLKLGLLQKAFEGKLIVQDPTDETASVLLERIKKEREEYLINNKIKKKGISQPLIDFPIVIPNIAATDLHAGIISMIIDAHVCNTKYSDKLNHVKCEKIIDLVERKLGISLGRKAMKDAAGPDDYPHLKKVEHRAKMIGAFSIVPLEIGHTYRAMKNMPKCIEKAKTALTRAELEKVTELINTFLPFDLEHAELVATIYAGWNNLLIKQQIPSDEEIVYESRENWSKRKLTIPRENFFKTLNWMRAHNFVPQGKGQLVLKNNKA